MNFSCAITEIPIKPAARMKRLSLILAFALSVLSAQAELRLPALVGNHMVLQRDIENPIWGWADPGTPVSVMIAGQTHQTKADESGRWKVRLAAISGSSHALKMSITTPSESITLSNIVIGEVWICSGQSNMQFAVKEANDGDLEVASANYPNIRIISVPQVGTQEKQDDFQGQWEICTPETISDFSAVGYFFGRQLYQTLGVPIGLIDDSWGGSAAEAWVSRETLEADSRFQNVIEQAKNLEQNYDFDKILEDWKVATEKAAANGKPAPRKPANWLTGNSRPGNIWAGVLNPTIGYGIRGVIWYQGESNAGRAYQYRDLFSLMISEWRKAWGIGDFPFYWVQLADFHPEVSEPGESSWAELREAQTQTLSLPNTGQAVICDLGEGRDIHPRNKQDVAKRLARIALSRDYGHDFEYQSPTYRSMELKDGKILLTFDHVGKAGLYSFDTVEVVGFALAGEDRVWHRATGKIVGPNQVEVSSAEVSKPVAARYGWADNPVVNLYSKNGLPATPFRTDDWPLSTDPANQPAPPAK